MGRTRIMAHRIGRAARVALLLVITSLALSGGVLATPPSGVVGTTLGIATFDGIDTKTLGDGWQARVDAKGATDVQVIQNRITPGGSFGWHRHPGPSLVVVASGTLTLYRGDDPTCTPEIVPAGQGFVDQGGDVHLVRNEGSVETVVYVTSLIPHGAARRIDEPAPGNCAF